MIGGDGNDIILGDLGRVYWYDSEGANATKLGGGGYGDFSDGIIRTVSYVASMFFNEADGGADYIKLGDGDNLGVGGLYDDEIIGGDVGRDIIVSFINAAPLTPLSDIGRTAEGTNDTIFFSLAAFLLSSETQLRSCIMPSQRSHNWLSPLLVKICMEGTTLSRQVTVKSTMWLEVL